MMKGERDPLDAVIGNRVRIRRMSLNISQEKLADGLGLTFQQVQKYEKGTNRIGAGRLVRIAHLLQTPVSFFYDNLDGDNPAPAVEAYTAESIAMLHAFQKIGNAGARATLLRHAKTLAGEE